jgi:hypothetical protein
MATRCLGGTEALWKALYERIFDCSKFAQEVGAGSLSYDAQKGAECLEQISKLDCSQSVSEVAACDAAVVGKNPSGGSCATALGSSPFSDCAPGNRCRLDSATCGGTCTPDAVAGESCLPTAASGVVICAKGLGCQLNRWVCVADVTEGQPCKGPTAGRCADGLYCEGGTTSATGVCRARKTAGACVDDSDCISGYLCIGSEGSKTCHQAKMPSESCTPGLGECYPLFGWCDSDGKCTDVLASENQPCGLVNGELIMCASGLVCESRFSGAASTCLKRGDKANGATCTSSVECAGSEAYCDTRTKKCVSCS